MNQTAQLAALTERLRRARRQLDREAGAARTVAVTGQRLTAEVAHLSGQVDLHEQAAALLASIGEDRQTAAQTQIETLVTKGLQTIFGADLSFHLVPGVRAKTPVVDFVVRSGMNDGTGDTVVDTDVLDARGGGLAATVGFLLRLVILLLSTKGRAGSSESTLLLDETFAHVSAEYEPRLAEFLRELVDKTGVQIILVTHSDAFTDAADVRYRFELTGGVTTVRAV